MKNIKNKVELPITLNLAMLVLSMMSPAHAFSSGAREQCIQSKRIDIQHSCACDQIKEKRVIDSAPFDINRPDLMNAFGSIIKSDQFLQTEATRSKLIENLKSAYEKERSQLYCHDKTRAEVTTFAITEPYCTLDAQNDSLPWCMNQSIFDDRDILLRNRTSSTLEQVLRSKAKVDSITHNFFGTTDLMSESLSQCNDEVSLESLERVRILKPFCKVDLEAKFPDNVYEFTAKLRGEVLKTIRESECFKSNQAIEKVEINSSSNLLANTGDAAQFSFYELSQKRAETINEILKNEFSLPREAIVMNYEGKNKGEFYRGTSGPCPYVYDVLKDSWEMKSEYKNGLQNLNEYKKVSLNVYFNEGSQALSDKKAHRAIVRKCSKVKFKCAP